MTLEGQRTEALTKALADLEDANLHLHEYVNLFEAKESFAKEHFLRDLIRPTEELISILKYKRNILTT